MKRVIILLLSVILLEGCYGDYSTQVQPTSSVIESELPDSNMEETLSECNKDTVNCLFYEKNKIVKLYFSGNIALFDISRVDLCKDDEVCKEDVSIENQYDNVLEICMEEYVQQFNYVRLTDNQHNELKIYVGEYFFEQLPDMKEEEEVQLMNVGTQENDTKEYVEISILEEIKDTSQYTPQCFLPTEASKYFTDSKKIEQKDAKKIFTYKYNLREKFKTKKLTFEVILAMESVVTGENSKFGIMYIPMGAE